MNVAPASVGVQNLVFSSWKEVKHKADPHNYIEFFLVTDTGNEVLAISAEDHGNSHYIYHSTGTFSKYGVLNSKNRADTISWLEMIIKDSQVKVDSQLAEEVAHAGEPTPDNPLGLYYTQHKAEKAVNPDGTHTQRFFLLDQYGTWHLAVVGEERDTRDGHYVYKATEEFAARYPLSCHAQKDVIHWLEQRVTHGLSQPLLAHRHCDASSSAGAAASGAAAPSVGSADAWGPTGHGSATLVGYSAAATPNSAPDGTPGTDGAGLMLQAGGPARRQLTPPSPAAVMGTCANQQQHQHPLGPLARLDTIPHQQQHQPPPQEPQSHPHIPGLPGLPAVEAGGSSAGLLQLQHHPDATHGMTHYGEPPAHPQQLPPQNGVQRSPMDATSLRLAAVASDLPAMQQQHQQHEGRALMLQRGIGGVSAMPQLQQEAHNYNGVASQQHQHLQQQALPQPHQQQPMLVDPPLQLQQQGHQLSQPALSSGAQGLAQLLELAGLAASMPGAVGLPSQPVSSGPPLQLQLPMPPQLQLQGTNMPQLSMSLQQQAPSQQLTVPSLFQNPPSQQQQQRFQQFSVQPQLQQQEQQLKLLQQQIAQQQQQLQQLLQGNPGPLGFNSAGAQQQQQLQSPGGLLGGSRQQCLPPSAPLQLHGPPLNTLQGRSAGGQAWNMAGGFAEGALQQPAGQLSLLPSSRPSGMTASLQSPSLMSRELSGVAAAGGLSLIGNASASLAGACLGESAAAGMSPPGPGPAGATASAMPARASGGAPASGSSSGGAGPSPPRGQHQVGGGGAGGGWSAPGLDFWSSAGSGPAGAVSSLPPMTSNPLLPSHTHPQHHVQQAALSQPFAQPGAVADRTGGLLGPAAGGGGGDTNGFISTQLGGGGSVPLSFSCAAPLGAAATGPSFVPPRSPVTSQPGDQDAVGSAGSIPAAAGPPLLQPFAAAAGQQAVVHGALPPPGRSRDAGPGSGQHHGGRGGAGGRGSGGKHKLAGVAEEAHKRKLARLAAAGEEAVRLAQGAYLASLRHQALSEAAQQEALRKTIASWVRGQMSEDEVSVSSWHDTLQQMLRDATRTRPVSVPFLPHDRLRDLTRASAEAITLAAAVSLTVPLDPTAGPPETPTAAPAAAVQPPRRLPPAPSPQPAAAPLESTPGCGPAAAVLCGGGTGSAAAGTTTAAAQPAALTPASEEQLAAAVISLKALLMGDLNAAGLGSLGTAAAHPASDAAAPIHGLQQAPAAPASALSGAAAGAASDDGAIGMQLFGAKADRFEVGAAAGQTAGQQTDVIMADAAPVAAPQAGAPRGAAASAHLPPPTQQPQQQSLPPPLPIVPPRPSGPVGGAAVVACAGSAPSWSFADPHLSRHGVRVALESLREIAALCPPVANMASSSLVETVKQFESHPHPSVSGLAREILMRWRGSLVHRLRSMSDSRCYQDPVAVLESKISANEIVFPNLNELLGVPRSSATTVPVAAADGAALPGAPAAAAPLGGVHTPFPAVAAAGGTGFATGSGTAYSLASTPASEGLPLAGFSVTPPLINGAGTPALTTAGTATSFGATRSTITPVGGLMSYVGGVFPGGNGSVAATSTAEAPQSLFDAVEPPGRSGSGSLPTPQLFNRPSGAGGAPVGPGVLSLPLPEQIQVLPFQPLFPVAVAPPAPSPGAAAAASAPVAVVPSFPAAAPSPQRPQALASPSGAALAAATAALATLPAPAAEPQSAPAGLEASARATTAKAPMAARAPVTAVALLPSEAAEPGNMAIAASDAATGTATEAVSVVTPSGELVMVTGIGLTAAPEADNEMELEVEAAPTEAAQSGPQLLSLAVMTEAPVGPEASADIAMATAPEVAAADAKAAVAVQRPEAEATPVPEPRAAPQAAEALQPTEAGTAQTAAVAGTVAAAPAQMPPPLPRPQSGGDILPGSALGSAAVGPFGTSPPFLLSGLPLLPQSPTPTASTTAEVAALLAASAQSLAAHLVSRVEAAGGGCGGGATAPSAPRPPRSFSPAQLSQLGALAASAKAYAAAIKTSDAAGAPAALQRMVLQLRLAHALNLGGGGLGPGFGARPLLWPVESSVATTTGVQLPRGPSLQQGEAPASAPLLPVAAPEAAAQAGAGVWGPAAQRGAEGPPSALASGQDPVTTGDARPK